MLRPVGTLKLDSIGRLIIPKYVRNALQIGPGSEVDMYMDNGRIIIQKYTNSCSLCGSTENTHEYRGKLVCEECIKMLNYMYVNG